ncbi:O-acetyl-ADP-ribose deacetylase [Methyloligella halotolerans]|uniref:O-acetyl-ADP-ribose deacetylase n=1 Tax=Methyloligella halotolerans TaxID=1177755 RepID=A0A1E2RVI8_9HYPH|nr:O-acetyl-ADP-ribose deacetylase [Methyloligella halotolerans]ODA66231.1 O-acetyl-ADP-ribose deacetylase [Methyloligella halotolerans]
MKIVQGDITRLDVDAIVNAANGQLAPGGGVCGAIHRAAGSDLAEACAKIGGCPTGEARITPGFDLKARYVIHAVGPVWHGGDSGEDEALAACYRNAIALANENGLRSIAFPAISTGIYGFPPERAATLAVEAAGKALAKHPKVERVIFCCFDDVSAKRHRNALAAYRKQP